MNSKKPSFGGSILHWLPGIILSLAAVYLLSKYVNLDELGKAIQQIRIEVIGIIAILVVLSMLARGLAWQALIGEKATLSDSFFGVCVGYLLNNLIPRSGEIGKAVLLGSSTGLGTLHVLSTVVVERALDLTIAACMFLSTLPMALPMDWMKPIAVILLICVIAAFLVLFTLVKNQKGVVRWFKNKGEKSALIRKFILPGLESVLNGFSILVNPIQFLKSFLYIATSWVIWTTLFYIALISFVPQAPLWWGIFCQAVLAMGIALPSAPAGLGVYEGTMVVAL